MRASAVSDKFPNFEVQPQKQIVKNIKRVAIPVIALTAISMISGAQAITYVECFDNCNKTSDASGIALLLCQTLCLVFAKG